MELTSLQTGNVNEFRDVAAAFGMKPAVLTWQGGIISRPALGALLVITRPDADSLDYHDRWVDGELIYGARGRKGDQSLKGANGLLATNARTNYVFEALGSARLRFHGTAHAVSHWWDEAPDVDGVLRKVVRYLLRFGDSARLEDDDHADEFYADTGRSEGTRVLRQHLVIERNRGLVSDAKRRWRSQDPLLRCEVCRMSFRERYGERGDQFIEAHHRAPLSSLTKESTSYVNDLAPVCANCHRMLHATGGCSIEHLRQVIQELGAARAEYARRAL